jgi:ATP-dependent Clp protease protease subunit
MLNEPIRCFEGSAKPHEPFWTFRDSIEGGEPELELNGYISEYSWFDDDITPALFKADLQKYGAGGPITIRMTSYGGDAIAASRMHTIIKDYPGRVTVQIDGVAASAATVVAIAGDVVKMQETAYFMIHDPSMVFFLAQLNIEDMTRMVESLKAVKEGIVNAYESRTGLSRSRLATLMTNETWMDAQKAADLGFVDEIIRGEKKVFIPENAAVVNTLRTYVNVPAALLKREPVHPTKAESPDLAKFRAEVTFLKG